MFHIIKDVTLLTWSERMPGSIQSCSFSLLSLRLMALTSSLSRTRCRASLSLQAKIGEPIWRKNLFWQSTVACHTFLCLRSFSRRTRRRWACWTGLPLHCWTCFKTRRKLARELARRRAQVFKFKKFVLVLEKKPFCCFRSLRNFPTYFSSQPFIKKSKRSFCAPTRSQNVGLNPLPGPDEIINIHTRWLV